MKWPCGKCEQECRGKTVKVQLAISGFTLCANLPTAVLNYLGKRGVFWNCEICIEKSPFEKLSQQITGISKIVNELKEEQSEMKIQQEKIVETIPESRKQANVAPQPAMKDDGRTQFQLRIDGVPEAIADTEEKK